MRQFPVGFGGQQTKNGMAFQSRHPFMETPPSLLPEELRWAQGEGKSSVTGKNILHFPLEQNRGGRSVVGVKPIRNLSLIRNNDPLTRSSNLQAPLAHAREREGCRECPIFRTSRMPHDLWGIKIISWSISGMIDKYPGAGSSPGVPSSSPAL